MEDELERKPEDSSEINLGQDWEISYWTKSLGCSAGELIEAVKAVGNSTEAVRQFLAGNH